MAGYYDAIDIHFTEDGDYYLDESGDLSSNERWALDSVLTEVKCILRSSEGDWQDHPGYAADLKDFVGYKNTRSTGKLIEDRIKTTLILNRLLSERDLYVRAVPVSMDAVMVILRLNVLATPANGLTANEGVTLCFMLDLAEGGISFLSPEAAINYVPVGA